ncbi:Similar to Abhydrolase domain-containing protein FAM108C1; acc. no. Q7ZVZ7 [Pyronema omphalodes CBS 100304]|uniref:Similar to Abhydrolase domain-containing protein FAM108C1 acc. no. Q7ZVZ7 n=1 Tax=Pyronema omphalodes (strain CBS 100304) TaxID=1076935 RepID=U4LKP4_PYROM|nr:Similar to Abhydrolase domain-containing protein FAM108C1; acc. no. Q7ZVZ7 [Pyronema omphalodes CBS 100304]
MSTIRSNSSGINSIEEIRDRITDATFLKARPDAARDEVHTETKKLDRLDANSSIEYVIIHPVHTRTSSGNRQAEKLLYICHAGVGSCIDNTSVRRWQKHANKNNVDIFLHNYPGYGDTTGRSTEDRICQDALQLLKEVYRQEQEVVLFGESIGCGPTMYLASSNETRNLGIKQMVLLSPLTSLLDLLVTLQPKYGLSAPSAYAKIITILEEAQVNLGHHKGKAREGYDSFRSLKLVEKLHVKDILVVHGKGNETIPVELAKICSLIILI